MSYLSNRNRKKNSVFTVVYWVLYLRRKKYVYSGAYPFLPPLLQVFLFCNLLFKQIQSKCFSHFLFFRFLRGWNVTNHVHNFYTCPHSLFCLKLARLYTQLEVDRGNSNPLFYRPNPHPTPKRTHLFPPYPTSKHYFHLLLSLSLNCRGVASYQKGCSPVKRTQGWYQVIHDNDRKVMAR